MNMEHRRFYNAKEIASYLGFSVSAIRKWVRQGTIRFHKINGGIRFDIKEIDRWVHNGGLEEQ